MAEWDWFHLLLTLVPHQRQLLRPAQGQAERSGGILPEGRALVLGTAPSSSTERLPALPKPREKGRGRQGSALSRGIVHNFEAMGLS